MSAEDVKSLVTNKTAKGVHLKKSFSYTIYFAPDGSLHQIKTNGDERKGEWEVKDNGKHCVTWDDSDRTFCRFVRDNGDQTYTKIKVKYSGKEIPILIWRDFSDGNNLGS